MLTLTHRYRIYPDIAQEQMFIEWLDICRGAYNYALREIKDWCDSRKCLVDRCSLKKEYILSPELKFPGKFSSLTAYPKPRKNFPSWVTFLLKSCNRLLSSCMSAGSIFRREDLVFLGSRSTGSLNRYCFLNLRVIR